MAETAAKVQTGHFVLRSGLLKRGMAQERSLPCYQQQRGCANLSDIVPP